MPHLDVSEDRIYVPSDEIVAREIEGELIIVPLTAGVGDVENALYTFNETGRAVWEQLKRRKVLGDAIASLQSEFDASGENIREDVLGLVEELLKKKIVVEEPAS